MLLQNGANVNVQNRFGNMLLQLAVGFNFFIIFSKSEIREAISNSWAYSNDAIWKIYFHLCLVFEYPMFYWEFSHLYIKYLPKREVSDLNYLWSPDVPVLFGVWQLKLPPWDSIPQLHWHYWCAALYDKVNINMQNRFGNMPFYFDVILVNIKIDRSNQSEDKYNHGHKLWDKYQI